MAETLGSLIDKLTIKAIREFYISKMLQSKSASFSKPQLKKKLVILKTQKELLFKEIEDFIAMALKGGIAIRDEKLKLYNKPDIIGRIGNLDSISKAIDGLSKKNIQLWQLEDQARREDVPLSYIGGIKRNIDIANQERNDLIDKIDELLQQKLKPSKRKS
jgi:hypothetical protein